MNTKKCFLLETLDKFDKEDISRAYAELLQLQKLQLRNFLMQHKRTIDSGIDTES